MPWLSLPYGDERIGKLMTQYKITAIPALIILDAKTGFKVTEKARKDLT